MTLFGLVLLVAIVVEATIHTFLFIYLFAVRVRELSYRASSSFNQSEEFVLEGEQSTTSQAEQRDSFATKFLGEGKSFHLWCSARALAKMLYPRAPSRKPGPS
jgi:hypothetical protein